MSSTQPLSDPQVDVQMTDANAAPIPGSAPDTRPRAKGGLRPELNPVMGAAIHHDLYRTESNPAAQRQRLKGEARKLGIAFFVFFSLIIGGLSLALNGAWRGTAPVVALGAPTSDLVRAVDAGHALTLYSGDRFVLTGPHRVLTRRPDLLVFSSSSRIDRYVPDDAQIAIGAGSDALEPCSVSVRPAYQHAWREAKLLNTVYTRHVVATGVVLGLLGLLVPVVLVPFYRFWMACVAAPLGFVNTRLILGAVFFLMFTPMALVLWVKRRLTPESDALRRAPLPKEKSYWIERRSRPREHFRRWF